MTDFFIQFNLLGTAQVCTQFSRSESCETVRTQHTVGGENLNTLIARAKSLKVIAKVLVCFLLMSMAGNTAYGQCTKLGGVYTFYTTQQFLNQYPSGIINKNALFSGDINVTGQVFNCLVDVSITVGVGKTATFTNCTFTMDPSCRTYDLWQGFIVDGDRNLPQFSQAIQNSGKLVLINCKVEWARTGVLLGSDYWLANGGIIDAKWTTFRNCRKGVEFYHYPFKNRSIFENCHFRTDEFMPTIYDVGGKPTSLNTCVSMWGVKGIKFRGCKFERRPLDSITVLSPFDNRVLGIGIRSIDATYSVENSCVSNAATLCFDQCANCVGGRVVTFLAFTEGLKTPIRFQ